MEARGLTRRVPDYCRRMGFPLEGSQVLCAVSGGVDSMCLLHLLWRLAGAGELTLCAATFDHRLRPQSGEEAEFVAQWCRDHNIPCRKGGGDVAALAAREGRSIEEAARLLRYDFLERCREELGYDWIATAHNADDNAETLLLHLLRGTGLRGLGGIPPRRGRIIRPLLELSRQEIRDYCHAWGVPWREDESNGDTRYTRNYLRHQVLPLLREKNPNLTAALTRTAESLREDEAYLARETERAAAALLTREGEAVSAPAAGLAELPPALALRLVQEMAERSAPGTVLPRSQRQAVLALAGPEGRGKRLPLTNRLQAARVYDMLTISPPILEGLSFSPLLLEPGEEGELPELGLGCACWAEGAYSGVREPDTLALAAPRSGPLVIRPRQTGDRIHLPGRPGKTLKKLFSEARLPQRERVPVLELEGRVAAVWGFGPDTDWVPLPGQPVWQIRLTKKD